MVELNIDTLQSGYSDFTIEQMKWSTMNAFNRRGFVFGVVLAFAGLVCGVDQANAEFCPPQCPSGKVALGIAAPMTGPVAPFGRQIVKPAEIAVQALNSAGGLLGFPVEVVIGDDRCNPGQAVEVAKRHIERDKIGFVIGPACPEAARAASPIYAKACVIQFVPAVTDVEFTRLGCDNLIRMVANDDQEAQALSAFIAREHAGKKLVVVYSDVFFRRWFVERLKSSLSQDATAVTRFEPLQDVTGAYDRLAARLQKDPPDVIYLALGNQATVEFVRKLRQRGVSALVIGGQRLLSATFWASAQDAAEGIHVIAPIGSLKRAQFRTAVDLLRQSNVVPDLVALSSFASVQTWAEAVRQAGSGDANKVMQVLRSGTFDTAIGQVAFDQKGDRRNIRFSVLIWQSGRLKDSVEWSQ